jgi:hypothetical protein
MTMRSLSARFKYVLPKLAGNQYTFTVAGILRVLSMFPNLKRLGLAHIALREGTWHDLLGALARLSLERLWLLDPRVADMRTESVWQ